MTTEQPTRPARPPRPGPAFRRAALGLPPDPSLPADGPQPRPAPRRESLREALARIPDLERDADHLRHGGDGHEVAAKAAGPGALGLVAADLGVRDRQEPGVDPDETASGGNGSAGNASGGNGSDEDGEADSPRGLRSLASRLLNGPLPEEFELHELSEGDVSPEVDGEPTVGVARAAGSGAAVVDAGLAPSDLATTLDESDLFTVVERNAPAGAYPRHGPGGGRRAGSDAPAPAPLPADAPDWLVLAAAEQARVDTVRSTRRPVAPWWRRVAFGLTVAVLIAAVPALGLVGYRLVSESTDGQFSSSVKRPTDPGYELEVLSTPTQLVLQKDATGRPVAATVLSLSGTEGGGAVVYVPLEAEVRTPGYGVDRIIRAYDVRSDDPARARHEVAMQVAKLVNVGLDGVVELDDRGWAQLVEPVAPLTVVNPDPVEVAGQALDSGEVELTAEQVGPYLAAQVAGESSFNRALRHEAVWTAWLEAVAASDRDDVVPGERASGMGLFARELAAGPVTHAAVPTDPDPEVEGLLRVDFPVLGEIMLAAVPMPDSPAPGARPTVRLLNGVSADEIPAGIIQTVVQIGGSVIVVGNGPSFGRDETAIIYADPTMRGYAVLLTIALGGGTPRLDPEAEDSVGLTVILGRDVVEGASVTTTQPAGATSTTVADTGAPNAGDIGADGDGDPSDGDTQTDTETDPESETDSESGGA